MTTDDKPQQPAEVERGTDEAPVTEVRQEEEEFTPFVDKFIAFVLLSIPFSALLVWLQDVLRQWFAKSVANIVLLIGIVAFLLSIGTAAKWIHRFRTRS